MNLSETALMLAQMQAYDQRTVGESDVIAWHALLVDAPFEDCQEAVRRHYAENTDRIMPAHVRRIVRDIHAERATLATATGWAPGQAGVPKDQAMPEVTSGPIAETTQALAQELLARLRQKLPQGSREALMPRRVAWEREHASFVRLRDAEPNPYYRPRTSAEADGGGRGYSADQVWVDEVPAEPAEDHSRCIDPTCPCNRPAGSHYDPMPARDDPALDEWLRVRGFKSYREWVNR